MFFLGVASLLGFGLPEIEEARCPMSKELMRPFHSSSLSTRNRFVMGPALRLRADIHTGVPSECSKIYYGQRAGAGLIISEPLHVSQCGIVGAGSVGMYDGIHVRPWKEITDRVHQRDGKIFANLFHAGRMTHSNLQINLAQPIAPSSVPARRAGVHQIDQFGMLKRSLAEKPRAMSISEIQNLIARFVRAAELSMAAGFDGVEIDAGHGYLIDQFLRSVSNQRDDAYGGSRDKRLRFAREVITAVGEAIGFDKIGLLVSPEIVCRDMADEEIGLTSDDLVDWASGEGLCYLNCALTCLECRDIPPLEGSLRLRENFNGPVIFTGNWAFSRCDELIADGLADLVGFDRSFIANPDLPARYMQNAPLSSVKRSTIYGGGHEGYIDYPCLDGSAAA